MKKEKRLKHLPYNKFKGILAEKGLTQKYIAELLDKDPATINQKINGTLEFTYSEIEAICDALDISAEVFKTLKVS